MSLLFVIWLELVQILFFIRTNSWIKGPLFIRPKVGANNSIFTWFFVYDKKLGCVCWALRYRDHDTLRCQNEISWPLFWNNRKANNGLCIVARNLWTQDSKPNLIVTSQVWPLSHYHWELVQQHHHLNRREFLTVLLKIDIFQYKQNIPDSKFFRELEMCQKTHMPRRSRQNWHYVNSIVFH